MFLVRYNKWVKFVNKDTARVFQDEDGNPLETEFGLSTYKDHQTFTVQVSQKEYTVII